MRPLMCLLVLVIGEGCAGDTERGAPWREPGLLHDKPSWLQVADKDKDFLKNSQPLPAESGNATVSPTAPAATAAQQQQLPSAGLWGN